MSQRLYPILVVHSLATSLSQLSMYSTSRRAIDMKTVWLVLLATFVMVLLAVVARTMSQYHEVDWNAPEISVAHSLGHSKLHTNAPDFVIFRQTWEPGSFSMARALLHVTLPLGFKQFSLRDSDQPLDDLLREESIREPQRKLIVLGHNSLTRARIRGRNVIIVDTVRDGFQQMTSYCRVIEKAESCSNELIDCLKGDGAKHQMDYRWAGAEKETSDNYINIPLSVSHPALSASALRIVFPNVTLNTSTYSAVGAACSRTDELLKVYNVIYRKLETQNVRLAWRLLRITGYFTIFYDSHSANATVWQMLDAAEEVEQKKHGHE